MSTRYLILDCQSLISDLVRFFPKDLKIDFKRFYEFEPVLDSITREKENPRRFNAFFDEPFRVEFQENGFSNLARCSQSVNVWFVWKDFFEQFLWMIAKDTFFERYKVTIRMNLFHIARQEIHRVEFIGLHHGPTWCISAQTVKIHRVCWIKSYEVDKKRQIPTNRNGAGVMAFFVTYRYPWKILVWKRLTLRISMV